ncbi:MAG: hypothetical protein NTZ83_01795 [Candidatus Pacearchaeota archaeon]|nr:hypothetical protein [Candidatus Pacearchaeota archaeon]
MKLDEYLKKLEECPDEFVEVDGEKHHRLYEDYYVYDNFPILLKGDFDNLREHLKDSGFKITGTYGSGDYAGHMLTSKNKASRVQLRNYSCFDSFWPEFLMKEGFNMFAYVHTPDMKNRDKWNIAFPEMAKTINLIGDYSKQNNLKLCFPQIRDGLGNDDLVFYDPDKLNISRFK